MRSDGAPSGVAVASATGAELLAGLVAPARELAQRVGVDLVLEQLHDRERRYWGGREPRLPAALAKSSGELRPCQQPLTRP